MSREDIDADLRRRALLPAGLRDILPPDAQHAAQAVEQLIGCLRGHGYQRIKPPLLEFEDSLFSGPGAAMSGQTFRVMDPVSQRMMGVRADMTVQVARLASTRLFAEARPLRLCYAGEVLRVSADALNPERELIQVGAELIGSEKLAAEIEVIVLAVDALLSIGIDDISVDLSLPTLVPLLCDTMSLSVAAGSPLRDALDHKDAALVAKLAGPASATLTDLMLATGTASPSLEKISALDLPAPAGDMIANLAAVIAGVRAAKPDLALTIDPVENRGFEYYSGIGFSLFRAGVRGELGRGGRYMANAAKPEPSMGFTLYMETLLRALPIPTAQRRLLISSDLSYDAAVKWRKAGWSTVSCLEDVGNLPAEAQRLGCSHVLSDGVAVDVSLSAPDDF